MPRWSPWRLLPDPRNGGVLSAPIGPGVYDLRHRSDKTPVLFGISGRVAGRMTSLLPRPYGSGTRNNEAKRRSILRHLADIEYRTLACASRGEALEIEHDIRRRARASGDEYVFMT